MTSASLSEESQPVEQQQVDAVAPAASAVPEPETLDPDEVRRRLSLNSPELVAAIFDMTQQRLKFEEGRHGHLNSKATALLTAAGLSLTVVSTIGAALGPYVKHLSSGARLAAIVCLCITVLPGFLAAIWAVRAMLVRADYSVPSMHAIFDKTILSEANAHDPSHSGHDDASARKYGLMEYQKFLTAHLWEVAASHSKVHEDKATKIRRGQWAFVIFLGLIFCGCIAAFWAFSSRRDNSPSSQAAQETSTADPGVPQS